MATTFSPTFKNHYLDILSGRASLNANSITPSYINYFNGAQPGDPTSGGTAGSGTSAFSSYSIGGVVLGNGTMTAASAGLSQIVSPRTHAVASYTTSSFTWARLYAGGGTAIIDTPVSLVGGGGGVIVNALSTTASSTILLVNNFSIKVPQINGTMMMNMALTNKLVDCITASNSAAAPVALTSATMTFYDGTPPASADLPATGSALGSISIGATSIWGVASGGSTALTGTQTITVTGTGTPTYARVVKSGYTLQGSVNTAAADFIVDSVSWVSGNNRSLTSATLVL